MTWFVALLLLLLIQAPARACSCFNPDNMVQRRDSSEVTLVGRLDSVHIDSLKTYRMKHFFTVSEAWTRDGKPAPKNVAVGSYWGSASCGWESGIGETSLVFTYQEREPGQSGLATSLCLFNVIDPDEGDLDSLRNGYSARNWYDCQIWPPRKRGGFDEARACLVERDSLLSLSETGRKLLGKRTTAAWLHSPEREWIRVDRKGKVVLVGVATLDNGPDPFRSGLVRVRSKGKWGYAEESGRFRIPAEYDGALPFTAGKAKACKGCQEVCATPACEAKSLVGGQWVLLNPKGKVLKTWTDSNTPN
jgi:hypothetical protein